MAGKNIFIFDTNVILNDPYSIFAYDNAEIVIPQTVLAELDKLKTGRADREVRFNGREFSRILFDLSQYGTLTDGIPLDNESVVRIFPFDSNQEIPKSLNNRNADDRILACAWQTSRSNPAARVVLVTNDLNMLLKAQTLGIKVQQYEYRRSKGIFQNFFTKFTGRRITMIWLAIPVILVGLSIALWLFNIPSPLPTDSNSIITPATDPLQRFATQELDYINQLKDNPNNIQTWMALAKIQLDWANSYQNVGRTSEAKIKYEDAANSYRHVVKSEPKNVEAINSLGNINYLMGNSDQAINEYLQAININPNFAKAHYNLGVVLRQRQDLKNAKREFENYLKIEPKGNLADRANLAIADIEEALSATNLGK